MVSFEILIHLGRVLSFIAPTLCTTSQQKLFYEKGVELPTPPRRYVIVEQPLVCATKQHYPLELKLGLLKDRTNAYLEVKSIDIHIPNHVMMFVH